MAITPEIIHKRLRQVAQRLKGWRSLGFLMLSLSVSIFFLVVGLTLDMRFDLSIAGRWICFLMTVLPLLAGLARATKEWTTPISEESIARRIETASVDLKNELINAVQLDCELAKNSQLRRALFNEMKDPFRQVPWAVVFNFKYLRKMEAVLCVMAFAPIILAAASPEDFNNSASRIFFPSSEIEPLAQTQFCYVTPGEAHKIRVSKSFTVPIESSKIESIIPSKDKKSSSDRDAVAGPSPKQETEETAMVQEGVILNFSEPVNPSNEWLMILARQQADRLAVEFGQMKDKLEKLAVIQREIVGKTRELPSTDRYHPEGQAVDKEIKEFNDLMAEVIEQMLIEARIFPDFKPANEFRSELVTLYEDVTRAGDQTAAQEQVQLSEISAQREEHLLKAIEGVKKISEDITKQLFGSNKGETTPPMADLWVGDGQSK